MTLPLPLARSTVALGVIVVAAACRTTPAPQPAPTPATGVRAAVSPLQRLVPKPSSAVLRDGAAFTLTPNTVVAVRGGNAELMRTAELLAAILRPSTGYLLPVVASEQPTSGSIVLGIAPGQPGESPDAYRLVVSADRVEISASTPAGVFRGTQTLRQMLPASIESHMRVGGANMRWTLPSLAITDAPRFAWRGAMLDVSRHFFTVYEVEQYIDMLALYKMNILHLHLADDQGWRIEIKSRPQLVAKGSVTEVGAGKGGFYTQDDYASIVRYAQERYITVVPEIDMPGHTNAALVAFPELSCGKWPPALYTGTEVGFSSSCVDKEETYALIEDIVREMAAITPGPWLHMGGDEVEVLTPPQYAGFVERVERIVLKHGKQMVGWEEVNKAKLDRTTLIQQWRGDTILPQPGHRMIMSPGRRLYLDMKHDSTTELGLRWAGLIDVRQAYDWDPAMYNPGAPEPSIIGIESPIWAETLRNISAVMYLALPRIPAVAEVAWTPQASRDWEDFRQRLATHAPRWNYLGMNWHRSVQIPW